MSRDSIKWWPIATVSKYTPAQTREMTEFLGYEPKAADWDRYNVTPGHGKSELEGNALVTQGLDRLGDLFTGISSSAFTASQGVIGVGNSTTAFNASQTTLQADGASAWYQAVDGAPTSVNGVMTAVSTFASGDGNFAWEEWCWVIVVGAITPSATLANVGATSELMINRKVGALGTKASGASWVFTTTVTLS